MDQVFCVMDFETRSLADLKRVGAHEYAVHPSTQVLCVSWKIGTRAELASGVCITREWVPMLDDRHIADELIAAFTLPAIKLVAHNAGFEQVITKYVLRKNFPGCAALSNIPIARWVCTAAMAAAHALPRNLGNACMVLGLEHQKDKEGTLLIRRHCLPQKPNKKREGIWNNDEAGLRRLSLYCARDIEATTDLFLSLPMLTEKERQVWMLNQRINTRGVYVDRPLVATTLELIKDESKELNHEAIALTGGIEPTRRAAILEWLKRENAELPNLQAKTVQDALTTGLVQGRARRLLEIRQAISKTSTAKYAAFESRTRDGSRLRDLQLYHGASTGRESGQGVQIQNLPRPVYDQNAAVDAIRTGDRAWVRAVVGEPMVAFSSAIRGCITASPGHEIFCGDFNAIEARVVWWVAGYEPGLELFRDGVDPYKAMASKIYDKPIADITDDQRFVGKTATLGLGFGMGANKFQAQCKMFGRDISEELAKRTVFTYRNTCAPVVQLWGNLERAAIASVKNPGKVFAINRTKWFVQNRFLYCELPSGRRIAYFKPLVKWQPTPWGDKRATLYFESTNPRTRKWESAGTYGGALTENIVQAIARDCMVEAQLRTEAAGYIPLMSVHDELVSERKLGEGDLAEFEKLMAVVPDWAKGLPVAVKGWNGARYRK